MVVKVLDLDRLVMHYGWMLEDLKEARKRVDDWGFDVAEELRLVKKVRGLMLKMRHQGREGL